VNINIPKSKLETHIVNSQPFIDKKDISQLTSHIYLEAKENKLIIKATDYELYLQIEINDIEVIEEDKVTLQAKRFLDIIKRLKNENINIFFENNKVTIKQQNSIFKLLSYEAEQFPNNEAIIDKNQQIKIHSKTLIDALKKVAPSIAVNNPKYELNGTLIDIRDDEIKFVSTDTRRLSIVTERNSENNRITQLIIPKKAITEIIKLFNGDLIIYYGDNHLTIESNNYLFSTKLLSGTFPEYERIVPKESRYIINLNREELIDSIKTITSISSEIKIEFLNHKLIFKTLQENDAEAKTNMSVENLEIAENLYLAVNSKYILDFLLVNDSEEIVIKINDSNQPFILEDKNSMTIVMPIII
jgi:DNA polymerase-3 subunit beta